MPPPRAKTVLRSVLALVLAVAAVPAVNLVGDLLSSTIGLPPGGGMRLAVDLGWVFLSGLAGSWLAVRVADAARTAHAWAVFALYQCAALYAVTMAWEEFPRWFTLGLLLSPPLQAWLGWRLAGGRRRA